MPYRSPRGSMCRRASLEAHYNTWRKPETETATEGNWSWSAPTISRCRRPPRTFLPSRGRCGLVGRGRGGGGSPVWRRFPKIFPARGSLVTQLTLAGHRILRWATCVHVFLSSVRWRLSWVGGCVQASAICGCGGQGQYCNRYVLASGRLLDARCSMLRARVPTAKPRPRPPHTHAHARALALNSSCAAELGAVRRRCVSVQSTHQLLSWARPGFVGP